MNDQQTNGAPVLPNWMKKRPPKHRRIYTKKYADKRQRGKAWRKYNLGK